MSDLEDQRAHPRYAIDVSATVEPLQDADGSPSTVAPVVGRTCDLSLGGLSLNTAQPLGAGTTCRVRMALRFSDSEFSEEMEIGGVIMWCSKVAGRHQLGIKFTSVTRQALTYLALFIRFLEGDDEDDNDGDDQA